MGNVCWRRLVLRSRSGNVSAGFGALRIAVTAVLIASWIVAVVLAPGSASSWAVPAAVVPLLLLWRARVGAATGVLVAVADVLLVADSPLHAPFVVHGVLSLLGFVLLGRASAPVAPVEAARPHPYFDDHEPRDPGQWRPGPRVWAVAATVVLVVAGLAGGQRDVGAWLVAVAFLAVLALAVLAERRSAHRPAAPTVVHSTL